MAYVHRDLNEIVAGMVPVQTEVKSLADRVAARARANLLAHRDEGESRIEVERASKKKDWFVSLVDEGNAAGAIERGGTRADGTPFEGLHVLGRAIGAGGR